MVDGRGYRGLAVILTLGAVGMVLWRAWVTDDAFITFRHVHNCLAGHGPVFNVGERVQGFSHPLWFLILLAGGAFFNIYAVAVTAGLACTAALVLALAWCLRHQPHPAIQLSATMAVLLSSHTFVEFQTSGLESSLTHLLVVMLFGGLLAGPEPGKWEQTSRKTPRVLITPLLPVVMLLCALLVMNRPDHLVLAAPIAVWTLVRLIEARRWRLWLASVTACIPALAWYGFATVYYGTPLPNTAYAKLGLPASIARLKGILYLRDYAEHEPAQALIGSVCLLAATAWSVHLMARRKPGAGVVAYLTLGLWLQLACVVREGGDFMRGRMLSSVLVGSIVLGGMLLGRLLATRDPVRLCSWAAALILLVACPLRMGAIEVADGFLRGWNYFRDEALSHRWIVMAIMALLLALGWAAHRLLVRWDPSRRSSTLFMALTTIQLFWLIAGMGSLNLPGPTTVILAVIWVGSGFLVASLTARRKMEVAPLLGIAALLVGMIGSICEFTPRIGALVAGTDITDEYAWYTNAWYESRFREPRYQRNSNVLEWARVGQSARRYADQYGPITVALGAIGIVSCQAGPKVDIVDWHGLTDPYIARLKGHADSRVGHVEHAVPPDYYRSRGVINLLPNWRERLEQLDPTLIADASTLRQAARWPDPADQGLWQLVNTITRGEILSRERLAQIPRYAWPRR